jgi:NAD(P)-dependent dehydrogenase (short-subunit alcohol dehydrogenase family)
MSFTPKSIPSLSGRVFFITGGTAGLGAGTISLLAQHNPAHIYFSGRNARNAQAVIDKVKSANPDVPVTFIECDLANLSSVKKAAEKFLAQADRLDVFYANAGIMALPPGTTQDGYELQFGTNHMGHALLIKLLLPLMQRTAEQPGADVRIILSSSVAYKQAPSEGIALETLKTPQDGLGGMIPGGKWCRYGQSKLANLLYARSLAKQYPNITSVSVHPGYIKTDLFANVSFMTALPVRLMAAGQWTSVEEGPYNQTWAGTTPRENLENGSYYVPVAKKGTLETASARYEKLADRLWEWTEKELAAFV